MSKDVVHEDAGEAELRPGCQWLLLGTEALAL